MWHILAQMMRPQEMRKYLNMAVKVAKDKDSHFALKWGALHFLCVAERAGLGNYAKFVMHQNALLQALLVPILPDKRYAKGDVAENILHRSAFEPGMALAEQLVRLRLDHAIFGIPATRLPSQVRNTFRVLGLVSTVSPRVDPVGEILSRRYDIQQWDGWENLLKRKYDHVSQLLLFADAAYDIARSQWLSYQNSFNNALFLAFQKWLKFNKRAGVVTTIGKNGKAVKFGHLVDPNQPFAKNYPVIASAFAAANARRNTLPVSHPYELTGGKRTKHLKKSEQTAIAQELSKAYADFIRIAGTSP
jgi:hypothetical protein